jgi:hypothetical protein
VAGQSFQFGANQSFLIVKKGPSKSYLPPEPIVDTLSLPPSSRYP